MDPAVLRADPARIESEVATILKSFGQGSGHIFNLGHGITPDIDPAHAKCFRSGAKPFCPLGYEDFLESSLFSQQSFRPF